MTQPKAGLKGCLLFFAALLGALILLPTPTLAQEEDPGFIRTLETDSAQVENAYYLEASFENDTSPHHWIYLYGEGLFVLSKDFGLEADFPTLDTWEPLGKAPAALGPIGLYLRYEFYQFGGWSSETGGAFSIEGGGAVGFPNAAFPRIGSSWTLEALGGFRVGKFFLQENFGYQGGIDPKVPSEWQVNTALGYHLATDWYVQGEEDFIAITAPFSNSSWSVIPQVAFQPGDWLFEFGESFNASPKGITEFMVARVF